jgi:acetyltransferase-like isoleucine patch superfamily enzyme
MPPTQNDQADGAVVVPFEEERPRAEAAGPGAGAGQPGGLPRGLGEYARAPGRTVSRISEWLNGRWQLRSCTQVGQWSRVIGRITVNNHGTMIVGNRVRIYAHHARSIFTVLPQGRLVIGDRTFVNYGCDIAATGLVSIGADCMIGTHVSIIDNDFHELVDRHRMPISKPVIIGDNVWIGNRAIILPGVTIGDGSVVGAGAVVVHDVPPGTLVVGNPARVVKSI